MALAFSAIVTATLLGGRVWPGRIDRFAGGNGFVFVPFVKFIRQSGGFYFNDSRNVVMSERVRRFVGFRALALRRWHRSVLHDPFATARSHCLSEMNCVDFSNLGDQGGNVPFFLDCSGLELKSRGSEHECWS